VKRYWKFILPAAALVAILVVLLLNLNSSLVYFNTPTELAAEEAGEARLRLGGQVVTGSVTETTEGVSFDVTDGRQAVRVLHVGAPQELFAEGIGVVVEGTWDGEAFHSDSMLVKHDEQYQTDDSVYDPEHPYGES
jgi:cytochrome c-type biogenesis protein CcmE